MAHDGADPRPDLEREYRFTGVERFPRAAVRGPIWHGYTVAPLPMERQQNSYLDTPTLALARRGITFRRRLIRCGVGAGRSDRAELTLKLSRQVFDTPGLWVRPELTEPISPGAPLTDAALLATAQSYAASEPIDVWFSTFVRRQGVNLCRGEVVILMTWDTMTLPDDAAYRDEEIEIELVAGAPVALDSLARLLVDTVGLQPGKHGKRTRAARHLARIGKVAHPAVTPLPDAATLSSARTWRS
jgi:inorganic triphosphatase YgiF